MAAGPRLAEAVEDSLSFAEGLFAALADASPGEQGGFTRQTYGEGEQRAHDIVAATARDLGLETSIDFAGNLYMTLPGLDRSSPAWVTGSHLDTVPNGGNFDGAAGVVAGMAAVAGLIRAGVKPPADVTVMAIRAEEASSWFAGRHGSHFGSRAALGNLPREELEAATSLVTGKPLSDTIREAGFRPETIAEGAIHLRPDRVRGFLELHIEQGPILLDRGHAAGVVTGIRGNVRARDCRCLGAYDHSGAVPRTLRSDAVFATVELVSALEHRWDEWEAAGRDLVCTVGRLFTDPKQHGLTKIPGEVAFTFDIRSQEADLLQDALAFLEAKARSIGEKRRTSFELGRFSYSAPAPMDRALQDRLLQAGRELGIAAEPIPCGAGHDAADFSRAGIPAAMIFVRSANGSHNPDEWMDMADFITGTKLLSALLAQP